ncbi:hypothetical protein Y023_2764 [Burkholderia pseudomallei A79D]|nr:hypothetical protein X962_6178 [Burkholderia pseudomallei MSHR7343]KGY01653.1 hypothetical protein Y023_2764 [Burkholderia pseudomallei A79D]KGY03218.1 hypothetical protein X997_2562 [Burkholderia pseudomallei A79C]
MRSSSKGIGLRGDALSMNKKCEPFSDHFVTLASYTKREDFSGQPRSRRATRHMLCRMAELCLARRFTTQCIDEAG